MRAAGRRVPPGGRAPAPGGGAGPERARLAGKAACRRLEHPERRWRSTGSQRASRRRAVSSRLSRPGGGADPRAQPHGDAGQGVGMERGEFAFPSFQALGTSDGKLGSIALAARAVIPWNRSLVSGGFASTLPELPVSIPACPSRASPATLAVLPRLRMAVLVPCCRLGSWLRMHPCQSQLGSLCLP